MGGLADRFALEPLPLERLRLAKVGGGSCLSAIPEEFSTGDEARGWRKGVAEGSEEGSCGRIRRWRGWLLRGGGVRRDYRVW
jgi:hypothetical protein